MRLEFRVMVVLLGAWCSLAAPARAQTSSDVPSDSADWMRIVPGHVGFYVEIRDLAEVRRHFKDLGIWKTVRELAEEEQTGATRPWQQRTEEMLGLSVDAAISQVLGRRTALFSPQSSQWQNGVLLAELEHRSDVRRLLGHWHAEELPAQGLVRCYELRGGLRLAVLDRLLVLGPAGSDDDYWLEAVSLLSGHAGAMLSGSSALQGLRARMSDDYPITLFATWEPGDPNAIGGCRKLLVGVSVEASEITCELRGQRAAAVGAVAPVDVDTLGKLPASTLAVWAGSYNFVGLRDHLRNKTGAGRDSFLDLTGAVLSLSVGGTPMSDLLATMGPRYVVVMGQDPQTKISGLEMPAFTVLCELQGSGEAHVQHLDHAIGFIARLLTNISIGEDGMPPSLDVKRSTFMKTELHHVEIGPVLAKRLGFKALEPMFICWTEFNGKLVVSTSVKHVEEIIRAASGEGRCLKDEADLKASLPYSLRDAETTDWLCVRGERVSRMVTTWLEYLERTQPGTLKPTWWQDWARQQAERRLRLGVGLKDDPETPGQAIVQEIAPGSPARDYLRVGDVIVGVGQARLPTSQPARAVAEAYGSRGDAREFAVEVVRGEAVETVTIPVMPASNVDLGEVDPVRALRQLIALSAPAEVVTVWRYGSESDRFDSRIRVKWKGGQ